MSTSEPARRVELPDFGDRPRSPPTAAELESIQEQAYAEGWQKGHAEGFAAGSREAREAGQRLQALCEQLASPLEAADARVREQLRELAIAVGESLARHTLRAEPEAVAGLLDAALLELGQQEGTVHIAMHPMDRAALPEAAVLPAGAHWHDDPDMARGDLRVWRGPRSVSGQLHERVALLAEQWLASAAQPLDTAGSPQSAAGG